MKSLNVIGVLLLTAACAFSQNFPGAQGNPSNLTRPGGVLYAPAFFWSARVISGVTTTGSGTIIIASSSNGGAGGLQLADGTTLPLQTVFSTFTPITVDWGQGNQETVTPTAVSVATCPAGNLGVGGSMQCAYVTASFNNTHGQSAVVIDGTFGLQTAIDYANSLGGGTVTIDPAWSQMGGTDTLINAAIPFSNVTIADFRKNAPQNWTSLPSTTTLLAAGTTLTPQLACDATHQFCSDPTIAGSASWSGAVYGCYTLVDINGNESPCSSTQTYTSAASKAIDMGVSFTARTDNVVGWKPYLSVSGGTYVLAYSVPLLTQPTVLLAAPVSAGVCTLTTLETTTPACAIANSTYNQTGSTVGVSTLFKGGMQFTGYPVVSNTLAPEIGSVSATAYNPSEEAHATYAYVPGNRVGVAGVQSEHIVFPITAAAQTAVGEVAGSIPLPANFMNYVGRTIEVCGLFVKTSTTADTLTKFQLWWDAEGSNVTAGTPVQLTNMQSTYATALAAAANFQFCQQVTTTVASTTATGGTITPGQGWLTVTQVAAGANPSASSTNLVAAVGSLNLALPAHLSLVVNHATGTDGAGATLIGATLRVVN
jgi:hypothetical protein